MTRKSTRRWVRSIGVATVLAMTTAGCAIAGAHSVAADPPSTPSSAVQVAGAEPVDTSADRIGLRITGGGEATPLAPPTGG